MKRKEPHHDKTTIQIIQMCIYRLKEKKHNHIYLLLPNTAISLLYMVRDHINIMKYDISQ